MSEGFRPAGSVCNALPTECLVCGCVILFGCLQDDLVPTSIHALLQQDQDRVSCSEDNTNDPNRKADRGRNSCCSCKYADDLEIEIIYHVVSTVPVPVIKSRPIR